MLDLSDGGSGSPSTVSAARPRSRCPTSGDGVVTSSTTGASGGFIDVGSPDAIATVTNNTAINVKTGASLTARDIVIETEGRINVKAVGKSDGIGFVALAQAKAFATATNNSTIDVAGGQLPDRRSGDLTINGYVTEHARVRRRLRQDRLHRLRSTVRSSATESHQNTVTVDGTLNAGRRADGRGDLRGRTRSPAAYADADGFGADGDANDDDGYGARVGQSELGDHDDHTRARPA